MAVSEKNCALQKGKAALLQLNSLAPLCCVSDLCQGCMEMPQLQSDPDYTEFPIFTASWKLVFLFVFFVFEHYSAVQNSPMWQFPFFSMMVVS